MEDYRDDAGRFSPSKYLSYLETLLTDKALDWSESHPVAIRLLVEAETFPSLQTIENFRALFCERFPSEVVEASLIPFNLEITELKQRSDKSLAAYYKRVTNIL